MKNREIFLLEDVNIPEYHVSLKPEKLDSFSGQLDDITDKIECTIKDLNLDICNLVFVKIFVSDYINQKPEIDNHKYLKTIVDNCVVSFIEQSPLDGTKISMLLYFIKADNISIEKKKDAYFIRIEDKLNIYQSITQYKKGVKTPYDQTEDAFLRHIQLLSENNLTLKDHCIRTWLYSRDVDKDYADIVEARNQVFNKYGLNKDTHFITSTGIEGKGIYPHASVNIDFYSIADLPDKNVQHLKALDYLNNTYEYGVAFERGSSITYQDKKHIFISGTASIDKEGNCVHQNDVVKQAERLFLNMQMLLKDTDAEIKDIAQMIVYLRNSGDFSYIENFLQTNYPKIPKVIVLGRVCRPEWLIEVECMAVKK